jgi:hypothetical protein
MLHQMHEICAKYAEYVQNLLNMRKTLPHMQKHTLKTSENDAFIPQIYRKWIKSAYIRHEYVLNMQSEAKPNSVFEPC